MTRNTLKNDIKINIPCSGASQNKSCREVLVNFDEQWVSKFNKTLNQLYGKETNYIDVMYKVIYPWYEEILKLDKKISISEFNLLSIFKIIEYFNIGPLTVYNTSKELTDQKREKGLQEIVKKLNGDIYINAIGGQKLYTKENFAIEGIDLKFIKNKSELPNTSILDLLFRYDKELIKQELNNYELI